MSKCIPVRQVNDDPVRCYFWQDLTDPPGYRYLIVVPTWMDDIPF